MTLFSTYTSSTQHAPVLPRRPQLRAHRAPILHSLSLKLTLAFLAVGLAGSLLVALFVSQRTASAFNQFLADRDRGALVTTLASYYEAHGSWDGVAGALPNDLRGPADPGRAPIVVVSADGRVVLGGGRYPAGAFVPPSQTTTATAIKAKGTVVGWLLVGPQLKPPSPVVQGLQH